MSARGWIASVASLTALAPLAGCVSISGASLACPAGETPRQVAELIFGRNIGQAVGVSEADFSRFLDEEVSPRFPDGFTVTNGQGRWLYQGVVYDEPSKRLTLILTDVPRGRRKVGEIATAYEARFRQDAVLSLVRPACVSFWLRKDRAKPAGTP